jgi:hypothetical protein
MMGIMGNTHGVSESRIPKPRKANNVERSPVLNKTADSVSRPLVAAAAEAAKASELSFESCSGGETAEASSGGSLTNIEGSSTAFEIGG